MKYVLKSRKSLLICDDLLAWSLHRGRHAALGGGSLGALEGASPALPAAGATAGEQTSSRHRVDIEIHAKSSRNEQFDVIFIDFPQHFGTFCQSKSSF